MRKPSFSMIHFALIFGTVVSAASLQYKVGKIYEYAYDTDVSLNNNHLAGTKVRRDIGVRMATTVQMSCVWTNQEETLVKVQFSGASLQKVSREDLFSDFKLISKEPLYFVWRDGSIGELFTPDVETATALNLKKGLVSLLQLQTQDGERLEVDSGGECTATYRISDTTITKTKTGCTNLDVTGQFLNVNHLLSITNSKIAETIYELTDGLIHTANSVEAQQVALNAKSSVSMWVQARQHLKLVQVIDGKRLSGSSAQEIINNLNDGRTYLGMLPVTEADSTKTKGQNLKDLVANNMKNLNADQVSSPAASATFLKMLPYFRTADKNTLLQILKSDDNIDILPQLLDLAVAAQTPAAQQALMDIVKFDDSYQTDLAERYLLAVAYSSHPTEALLEDLLGLYEKNLGIESLRASVSLALGAVLHTYNLQQAKLKDSFKDNKTIVEKIQNSLLKTLNSCEDTLCKVVTLRSLANARLSDMLPILMKFAEESDDYSVSSAALKGLKNLGEKHYSSQVKAMLSRIYHQTQRTFDSSVRTSALEIWLTCQPSVEDLRRVLLSVTDKDQFEMSKYVLEILYNAARMDENMRGTLRQALDDPRLHNYDVLASKGKSSALSGFMAETSEANSTFSLMMENSNVGIMKKSVMEVQLTGRQQTMPFISFGLFARGLESVAGDSADESEEEEVTAGLALDLMGVSLRPVTFFEGQSGLMSAVWNAPSSPTSVLQGNLLLHDHTEHLHLHNGLVVDLQVHGVVSFDLSGSITISLWNRNSHSVVTNSGAVAISSVLKINSPHFNAGIVYDIEATNQIDFTTDVNFYEMPFKMCLQMEQSPFHYSEAVSKIESAKGLKKRYRSQQKRKLKFEGKSFRLNNRNAQQCKLLISEE